MLKIGEEVLNLLKDEMKISAAQLVLTSTTTINLQSWTRTDLPYGDGNFYSYSNSDDFSQNGDYIKCNFDGLVLIYGQFTISGSGQNDIYLAGTRFMQLNTQNSSGLTIRDVTNGYDVKAEIQSGISGERNLYRGSRLVVIRLT